MRGTLRLLTRPGPPRLCAPATGSAQRIRWTPTWPAREPRPPPRPGPDSDPDAELDTQRVIDAFLAAAREGDFEALLEVLDPAVEDHGVVPIGASGVVRGAADVASQALAFARLDIEVRLALVNGTAGMVSLRDGRPFAIAGFTIRKRRIVEMDVLADPERLSRLDLMILD